MDCFAFLPKSTAFENHNFKLIGDMVQNFDIFGKHPSFTEQGRQGACITPRGNILASGNFCFRVFKLKLKVIKVIFAICTVYE